MRKRILKYERQKILYALTVILLLSIGVVIRDCELPLISINPTIDYFTKILFVHTNEDKTFYSIAISYIAAYIFFVIQVYIPLCINHQKGLNLLKTEIEKTMSRINLLILIVANVTERKDGFINYKRTGELFIVEENRGQILRISIKKTLWIIVNSVLVYYNKIVNSPVFCYIDGEMSKLILSLPVEELCSLATNICEQISRKKVVPIKDTVVVEDTKVIIKKLQERYDFVFEEYSITEDDVLKSEYYEEAIDVAQYTQNELEIKVKINRK